MQGRRILRVLSSLVALMLVIGCSTIRYVPVEVDRVKTEYVSKNDSVYVRDSIFITEKVKADTVYLTKEKFKYIYKVKMDTLHKVDTITKIRTVEVDKPYVPDYYKHINIWFWLLVSVFVVYIAYKIMKVIRG